MNDEQIYEDFIEYITNPVFGFPESEHKMPMIKSFISPEEAVFLTGFPLKATTLEDIAKIKEMDLDELTVKVKELCRKGILYEAIRGDSRRYRMWSAAEIFLRAVFWSGEGGEVQKRLAPHATRYYMDGFMSQIKDAAHPNLRALPIDETIEGGKTVMPYEDVEKAIDQYDYYTVSHCVCRERHRLDPDYEDSPYPSEVCLHFDELGRYIVENGQGREITKEETLDILKKAADSGLVHGLATHQDKPDTLCNCDIDYCTMFKPFHQLDFPKSMEESNYLAEVTPETCKACGLCVKRCPMDAVELKFSTKSTNKFRKAVVVDAELCIGCGVCVHKCKPKSITLKRKEEKDITEPPKDGRELVTENAMSIMAARQKQK